MLLLSIVIAVLFGLFSALLFLRAIIVLPGRRRCALLFLPGAIFVVLLLPGGFLLGSLGRLGRFLWFFPLLGFFLPFWFFFGFVFIRLLRGKDWCAREKK